MADDAFVNAPKFIWSIYLLRIIGIHSLYVPLSARQSSLYWPPSTELSSPISFNERHSSRMPADYCLKHRLTT
jgi:hypothetical protein